MPIQSFEIQVAWPFFGLWAKYITHTHKKVIALNLCHMLDAPLIKL